MIDLLAYALFGAYLSWVAITVKRKCEETPIMIEVECKQEPPFDFDAILNDASAVYPGDPPHQ